MKSLIIVLFLILSTKSFSQNIKIENVTLSYNHSIYRGTMNKVYIVLALNDLYSKFITVYVTIDKDETKSFELPLEKLVEISNEILTIKPDDIIFDDTNSLALDAPTISLSFSKSLKSVTYSVNALSKDDENSTRKGFLKIVQKILEIGDVKIRGIN